jgi:hypothetical protein
MGRFNSELELTPLRDGETWRVASGFSYKTNGGTVLFVPPGFETDLASVPRIFWNILPPFGKYTQAAVLHDWLYRTSPNRSSENRAWCDGVFREAMVASGVSWWQRQIIYRNVRWFGWLAWKGKSE